MNLTDVMRPVRHVLLDFDGPVCSVFGELPAPEVARRLADAIDAELPEEAIGTDPLALLTVYAARGRDTLVAAEAKLQELEIEAVQTAPITPGVVEALKSFRDTGRTVTIVSNNSQASVGSFLAAHGLSHFITHVCSRRHPEPELLKPSPFLLRRAIVESNATNEECVMVGDSTSDIQAAVASRMPAVAFANRADKRKVFANSSPAPTAIVTDLLELADAARRANEHGDVAHVTMTKLARGMDRG